MAYILKVDGTTEPLDDTSAEAIEKAVGGKAKLIGTMGQEVMFGLEWPDRVLPSSKFNLAATRRAGNEEQVYGTVVIGTEKEFAKEEDGD